MILPFSMIVDIIAHRLEGNGIRKTARLCGVDRKTVAHWSRVVGIGCGRLFDRRFRGLSILKLELDELHTFVKGKQRRLPPGAPTEHGDCWGYFALCQTSRAVVCYLLGKRTLQSTLRFVAELRARTVGRPHICTDGYGAYLTAIARSYGDAVDLLQLVKDYESVTTESGRRCADAFVRVTRMPMIGDRTLIGSSTNHVERFNSTVRHLLSKFARRSCEHAKSFSPLLADVAMLTASYNFVRVHGALRTTPAVALGVTDHVWSLDELVAAALTEPEPDPLTLPAWAVASRAVGREPSEAPAREEIPVDEPRVVAPGGHSLVAIEP